jgi:hypothetical protein
VIISKEIFYKYDKIYGQFLENLTITRDLRDFE